MDKELIFIGSVNRALRARNILSKQGITAKVERKSDLVNNNGCGYSIVVNSKDSDIARRILDEYKITEVKK